MDDRRPGDVPRTSHHLVPGTSPNWVPQRSRGRPHLELLHICFSSKKQQQVCKTRTIASKKTFFFKLSFVWSPRSPPKVPWRSWTLGPLGDIQGTFPGRRVTAGKILKSRLHIHIFQERFTLY